MGRDPRPTDAASLSVSPHIGAYAIMSSLARASSSIIRNW